MSKEWAEALILAGLEEATALHQQGDDVSVDTQAQTQLVDLSSLCIVDITGNDATSFLQGQFSNDLAKVTATSAQITGYCTPKGRLLALPLIVGLAQGYRLLIPEDIKDGFLKRLSMFIMRADVQVTERKECTVTGIIADTRNELGPLTGFLGGLPAAVMDAASSADDQLVRWHDAHGAEADSGSRARYLFMAGISRQVELWREGAGLPQSGQALWRLNDIRAGIPSITSGVLEAFVPQMLNLQLIGGLSFTKGCYPGQEIVARMQYLGKLKRHMRRFTMPHAADQSIPAPGVSLAAAGDEDAGRVVDAVAGPDGQVEVLAVVKVALSEGSLTFEGRTLTAQAMPYELPSLAEAEARQDAS